MKKTQKNKNIDKLFIICWKDHTANASWIDDIKKEKHTVCWSVGWLKDEDDDVIKLVDTYTEDKQVGGVMVILKSCLVEMYELNILD
tara:strand:+ start:941 stop:1201 length:261 start_codon:yes stop_codon:yes gene_type:complete